MFKKIFAISILLLSLVAFSNSAWAVWDLSDTAYSISGSLTVKANFPNLVTATVTLPKVQNLGEYFIFYSDNTFEGELIGTLFGLLGGDSYSYPEWYEDSKGNFTVYLDTLVEEFASSLTDLGVDVTYKTPNITGKVDSKGNISGKLNMVLNLGIDTSGSDFYTDYITGSITITTSYKGTYDPDFFYYSLSQGKKASGGMSAKKIVGDFIASIKSQLPKKQQ